MKEPSIKSGLHSRNRFRSRYDFPRLIAAIPELSKHVATNPHGDASIDFANPEAVKFLNQALLADGYGIKFWDIPKGNLCPPIPGRSDYLHHLADLLNGGLETVIPRGRKVSVLDVGTGANCIYPLIGAAEYGWKFVGAELDHTAFKWAEKLAAANLNSAPNIDIRKQESAGRSFQGVWKTGEEFDLTMCNPPFHTSAAEAAAGTQRKVRNLGGKGDAKPVLNFGGTSGELWCPGGELVFVNRMITQSVFFKSRCLWFTSLISKSQHLPALKQALRKAAAVEMKVIGMSQGQKQSRILAWSFLTGEQQSAWKKRRWE